MYIPPPPPPSTRTLCWLYGLLCLVVVCLAVFTSCGRSEGAEKTSYQYGCTIQLVDNDDAKWWITKKWYEFPGEPRVTKLLSIRYPNELKKALLDCRKYMDEHKEKRNGNGNGPSSAKAAE